MRVRGRLRKWPLIKFVEFKCGLFASLKTAALSITDLASCTYRRDKCVAIVAEASALQSGASAEITLRTTEKTSAETTALVENFWRQLGFNPRFERETLELPR